MQCIDKVRFLLGGKLNRLEVRSSLYVNSENATFILEEAFTSCIIFTIGLSYGLWEIFTSK